MTVFVLAKDKATKLKQQKKPLINTIVIPFRV